MRQLRSADLFEIWDRGRERHTVDRALVVLAFAYPERSFAELCSVPVGERNRLLLAVRCATFGSQLDLVTSCPSCREQLEFSFEFPLGAFAEARPKDIEVTLADRRIVTMRLPDSRDLAAVAQSGDSGGAQELLLRRCMVRDEVDVEDAPPADELAASFSEAVEQHDPLAVITFPVTCESCTQRWRANLDPVEYLWREIHQRVNALVREVHILARAYGWTQNEILSLSAAFRRLYIEQVAS